MSIAENIKQTYTLILPHSGAEITDYDPLVQECESAAVGEPDQDWDNGTTTYRFVDGSVLVIDGGDAYAYGAE